MRVATLIVLLLVCDLSTAAGCQILSSGGSYALDDDSIGAPYLVSGLPVCVLINNSDVIFDCAGHSITNNGTSNAIGILIADSTSGSRLSNITIRNCPSINGYTTGLRADGIDSLSIENLSVSNSTYGFYVRYATNLSLVSSNVKNATEGAYIIHSNLSTVENNAFEDTRRGLRLDHVSHSFIARNTVYRYNSSGINSAFGLGNTYSSNLIFVGTNPSVDWAIYVLYENDPFFHNNTFTAGFSGASVLYCNNATFASNRASNHTYFGFMISESNNTVLSDNTANNSCIDDTSPSSGAYWVDKSINASFTNCSAMNNQNGFSVYLSDNISISSSEIYGNQRGINLNNSDDVRVLDSEIIDFTAEGISSTNGSGTLIQGNRISYGHGTSSASDASIYLSSERNAKVLDNTLSSGQAGLIVLSSNDSLVSGNEAENFSALCYGIQKTFNTTIDSDTARSCSSLPYLGAAFYLENSDTTTLTNCSGSLSKKGIEAFSSSDTIIRDSIFYDNSQYGVLSMESDNTSLKQATLYGNTLAGLRVRGTANQSFSAEDMLLYGIALSSTEYANMSIKDSFTSTEDYRISWLKSDPVLSDDSISLHQLNLNLTVTAGDPIIDHLYLNWLDSEVVVYPGSDLMLYSSSAGLWNRTALAPDMERRRFEMTDVSPNSFSGFGVFRLENSWPSVTLISPSIGSRMNGSVLEFVFNASDPLSPHLNCTLYLGEVAYSSNEGVQSGAYSNFTLSLPPEGEHTWSIACADQANNTNSSEASIIIDRTPPIVRLVGPTFGTVVRSTLVGFSFLISDSLDPEAHCQLFVGGAPVGEEITIENATSGSEYVFSRSSLRKGPLTWEVACHDRAGNYGTNASDFTFSPVESSPHDPPPSQPPAPPVALPEPEPIVSTLPEAVPLSAPLVPVSESASPALLPSDGMNQSLNQSYKLIEDVISSNKTNQAAAPTLPIEYPAASSSIPSPSQPPEPLVLGAMVILPMLLAFILVLLFMRYKRGRKKHHLTSHAPRPQVPEIKGPGSGGS